MRKRGGFFIRAFLCFSILLLLYSPSFAFYDVYLKNGSVIRGVERYEKADGEMMLILPAGSVGVPEKEILKIEKAGKRPAAEEEAIEESAPKPSEKPAEKRISPEKEKLIGELRLRVEEIDGRIEELGKKEEEAKALDIELNGVNFRIEVLFQKGIKTARAAGASDAQWFLYLPEQEREWMRVNLMRQKELKTKMEETKKELAEAEKDKKYLRNEKQSLENQIRSLQQQPL